MFLALLLQATPHVNPNVTPAPDAVLVDTPSWMYSPIFWAPLIVIIAFGVYAIYKQATRKIDKGQFNR